MVNTADKVRFITTEMKRTKKENQHRITHLIHKGVL